MMTSSAGTAQERHVQHVNKIVGSQHLVLDMLLAEASCAGVLDDQIDVALPAGTITFVSRAPLLRMKRLAARPIDLADIERSIWRTSRSSRRAMKRELGSGAVARPLASPSHFARHLG